ncbi:MAG: hypothetical protein Kapaf2KO_21030 [Candidatus Kapaibacteriales bacterium]
MNRLAYYLFIFFCFNSIICQDGGTGDNVFEPKRDLIDNKTARQGLIFLGAEFRYFQTFTENFQSPNGEVTLSDERPGFGLGAHLEYFFDRKEVFPFSLSLNALWQSSTVFDLPTESGVSNRFNINSINTELGISYYILGSNISVMAGIGGAIPIGYGSDLGDDNYVPEPNDDWIRPLAFYVPLSIRYNFNILRVDGFLSFIYTPYITPMLENTDSQYFYGLAVSVRNPWKLYD